MSESIIVVLRRIARRAKRRFIEGEGKDPPDTRHESPSRHTDHGSAHHGTAHLAGGHGSAQAGGGHGGGGHGGGGHGGGGHGGGATAEAPAAAEAPAGGAATDLLADCAVPVRIRVSEAPVLVVYSPVRT